MSREEDRIGADVIVVGPHRRRDATGLGSTALAVVTNAAVPCLVARNLLRLPLIAAYASEHHADLVVLGTRGLGLDAIGRLGSVSAAVMQRLDVPALLVAPATWTAHASSSTK